MEGAQRGVDMIECKECEGQGTYEDDDGLIINCPICEGQGEVERPIYYHGNNSDCLGHPIDE